MMDNKIESQQILISFWNNLLRGGVKSLPLLGALIEQMIWGTLSDTQATEAKQQLNGLLEHIQGELEKGYEPTHTALLDMSFTQFDHYTDLSEKLRVLQDSLNRRDKEPPGDFEIFMQKAIDHDERLSTKLGELSTQVEKVSEDINSITELLRIIVASEPPVQGVGTKGPRRDTAQSPFRIFVSSTYEDLVDYRKAAEQAINDQNQKYEGMEYMGALDSDATTASLDKVAKCDLFIGIYAHRYGHVPDSSNKSITQQEYEHAKKLGKPRICYLVDVNQPWVPMLIEDNPGKEKLNQFKEIVSKERVRDEFKDPTDLKYKVGRDLSNWLAENRPDLSRDRLKPGDDPVKVYTQAIADTYATLAMVGFDRKFPMDTIYIPLTVHDRGLSTSACRQKVAIDQEIPVAGPLQALQLIEQPAKVAVVLGEPGMGKTTMLHYLARYVSMHKQKLPILVKLVDFSKRNEPLESYLISSVENYVTGSSMQEATRKALRAHQALVLLDGLDEVGRDAYGSVTEKISAFAASHKDCRVIITSRKAGFQCSAVPGVVYEIDKLPPEAIKAFVDQWFTEGTDLASRIFANPRILELAQNPFLLSIICLIFEKDKDLPRRRVELYEKCTVTLLTLYDKKKISKDSYSRLVKEQVLKDIADHFFRDETYEFQYTDLLRQVRKTLADPAYNLQGSEDPVLREIRENSGLLQESNDKHFFLHRTFFEYYVSRSLAGGTSDGVLAHVADPRWEEPIRLYAGQLHSIDAGTDFITKLWEKDRALALRCYADMDRVVKVDVIRDLLHQANVSERIALVKGLPEKAKPQKVVETLRELFRVETNGEVLYWGVAFLQENRAVPGAHEIVDDKFDKGAEQRYAELIAKDMVHIPKGSFIMGSQKEEEGRSSDETQHEVHLDGFYLSRVQVTNAIYERFDSGHARNKFSSSDDQPVVEVNWYEAVMFCRWLGCRLPTEAQWEYACRGGSKSAYCFGEDRNVLGEYAWFRENSEGKTHPVGKKIPNTYGLYDMHGNVWEWCHDWYGEEYGEDNQDPSGPASGSYRVRRGGGWDNSASALRSADRYGHVPGYASSHMGFRVALPARSSSGIPSGGSRAKPRKPSVRNAVPERSEGRGNHEFKGLNYR